MKNLTVTYLIALAIIAISITLSQFLVQRSITDSATDSGIINISGRQRMLSQKITKASYGLVSAIDDASFNQKKKELEEAFALLKTSHSALQNGSEELNIPRGKNSIEIIELFGEVEPHYKKINEGANALLSINSRNEADNPDIQAALKKILDHEDSFLNLMNRITFAYDAEASEKVNTLSRTEYILYAIALILLLLEALLIFRPAIRRINKATSDLRKSLSQSQYLTNQAKSIFDNVSQGIFMLDKNLDIDSFYSKESEKIFEENKLGGTSFLKLMKPRLMPHDLEALKLFTENLFNSEIREGVVNKLNPVEQVEIFTRTDTINMSSRFIKISFSRIIREGTIYRILVTVLDETENVMMKKQIEESEERNQKESTQLLAILKVNPKMLTDYIENSLYSLKSISKKYESHSSSDFSELISYTFNTLHTAKGNASLIGLELIEDKLHSTEDAVINLKRKLNIEGKDFLKIIYEVTEVVSILTNMKQMLTKIAVVYQQMANDKTADTSNDVLIKTLQSGTSKLSEDIEKPVSFTFEENNVVLPDEFKVSIKDISIQLIRNSLVHGIEDRESRKFAGKSDMASIKITLNKVDDTIEYVFEDDGQGIDFKKITQKAVQMRLIDKSEIDEMSEKEKLNLIFLEGFSTANNVDTNAGRGQGMDIISRLSNKIGGVVSIETEKGRYFRLKITFPTQHVRELKKAG